MLAKIPGSKRLKIFITGGVIVLALAGGTALWINHNSHSYPPTAPNGVNLAPATKEEKQAADDNKDRILAQQKNGQSESSSSTDKTKSSNGKKQVSVVITNATSGSVNAYITGVFEDGGTCTATFTQGSTTISRTSSGFENVSYTQCAPITPDLPNSGQWSVVVAYASPNAEGKSSAQAF